MRPGRIPDIRIRSIWARRARSRPAFRSSSEGPPMTHEQLSFSRAVRFLLPCVAAFGWIDLGRAADVDLPPAVPPYVSGWSGCYIGGHAGYGTTTSDSVYSSPASPVLDVNGFFTAVQTLGKF